MRDEDKPSHFENFNLVAFNISSFPIGELLNVELNIFQTEGILLYISVQDGAHEIRGIIKILKISQFYKGIKIVFFNLKKLIINYKILKLITFKKLTFSLKKVKYIWKDEDKQSFTYRMCYAPIHSRLI